MKFVYIIMTLFFFLFLVAANFDGNSFIHSFKILFLTSNIILYLFLLLTFFLFFVTEFYECQTDAQCDKIIKCKPKTIPRCQNYKCICYALITHGKSWNPRPKRVPKFSIM
jgi:hypothetical protein